VRQGDGAVTCLLFTFLPTLGYAINTAVSAFARAHIPDTLTALITVGIIVHHTYRAATRVTNTIAPRPF
jgi:hypothetical protein